MADSDRTAYREVTRRELRAPPARSGTRPGRLPARARADERPAAPAWDWSAEELSADELAELRAGVSALRELVAELERAAARARERERELRGALQKLAGAGLWQRRRLTREMRAHRLL
jgi:hypothetical protein